MSTASAFKAALVTACESAYTSPTVVTYGHHGEQSSAELVMVRGVNVEVEFGPMSTNRRREETLTATVEIYVGSGDTDQQAVTERAYALLDTLDAYLQDAGVPSSTQTTLGGVVRHAWLSGHDLEETDEPDDLARGRFARITATVTARARY
jgi:hypothetical protein